MVSDKDIRRNSIRAADKRNGVIIWRGASLIDGAPIVVILVGIRDNSTNTKTGEMLQTYILREDIDPLTAIHTGADESICGDCPHRGTIAPIEDTPPWHTSARRLGLLTGNVGRTCYVPVWRNVLSVYKALQRGTYGTDAVSRGQISGICADRVVRIGSYGDPYAVPMWVWDAVTARALRWTGYTHQWRRPEAAPLRSIVMASADSGQDAIDAIEAGWRYFRVQMDGADPVEGLPEFSCPASKEMGEKTTCFACSLCSGGWSGAKNVVIKQH